MSRRKAPAQRADHQTARKDATAEAEKQLREAQIQLDEASSFVFVCLQALRPGGEVDARCEIRTVLGAAYVMLVEDVEPTVAAALKALSQDGAE